ncbi:multicopper oxidase family protein [Pseudonocardia sp. D17]|uniref:multicopper oxidase family protein n=1 Tax=Pseudonocardia sp. D17 TaxID=882661 RepID=UPI0030D2AD55
MLERERLRQAAGQATVTAEIAAQTGAVDLGGPTVHSWTYGGNVPGPEIRLRAGDMLRANLRNDLPQPTTIHWHGIALRNDMDGVPVLTQAAVASGAAFRYEFTVPDPGTYIFHPHVGTQLDRGLYGALIVDDPNERGDYDQELVVLFDDWLDGTARDPDQVLADLKANGMSGMQGMEGMGGMHMQRSDLLGGDAGDVSYPYYLANGRISAAAQTFLAKAGQRVRLRLINIAGDTAFRIGVPGVPLTITHTDGFPVHPTAGPSVLLGMGERMDAIITLPDDSRPLVGIAEGKGGAARVALNVGRPTAVTVDAAAADISAQPVIRAEELVATDRVSLPDRAPDVVHDLKLGGPGEGYSWTINDQPYDPAHGLSVSEGQRVRLRLVNTTSMFHPMHLHGHTFQVRTASGLGARKDTVNVLPGRAVEVEFDADNPGQWLTHCHNVYHGEAGMMTVVSYSS